MPSRLHIPHLLQTTSGPLLPGIAVAVAVSRAVRPEQHLAELRADGPVVVEGIDIGRRRAGIYAGPFFFRVTSLAGRDIPQNHPHRGGSCSARSMGVVTLDSEPVIY